MSDSISEGHAPGRIEDFARLAGAWADASIPEMQAMNAKRDLALMQGGVITGPMPHLIRALEDLRPADWKSMSVLDVGCGVGHYSAALRSAGHSATYLGVDSSPHMIAKARAMWLDPVAVHADTEFRCIDATSDTLPQRDLVIDGGCMMHVADWRELIVREAAAARARLVLHRVPLWADANLHKRETSVWTKRGYDREMAEWRFKHQDVLDWCRGCGFRSVAMRPTNEGPEECQSWCVILERMIQR